MAVARTSASSIREIPSLRQDTACTSKCIQKTKWYVNWWVYLREAEEEELVFGEAEAWKTRPQLPPVVLPQPAQVRVVTRLHAAVIRDILPQRVLTVQLKSIAYKDIQ